jgi:formate dehydrogenase maturation protein FdhE
MSIQMMIDVLNHADAFILQFEHLKMITNVDFFSLYLAPLPDLPLPPIMALLASADFALETSDSLYNIIQQSLITANNLASQLPAINNVASQSLTLANLASQIPVASNIASQTLTIANDVASQIPVANNIASQAIELANHFVSQLPLSNNINMVTQAIELANHFASQLPLTSNIAAQVIELTNHIASQSSGLSTEVYLTDNELNQLIAPLLEYLNLSETNVVSPETLESFGLYTNSVIAYLAKLGYIVQSGGL